MITKKQYEDYHKELVEIWDNRANGIFDGRGCPACIVAALRLREDYSNKREVCDYCPLPKNACFKPTSYYNKFTDASRPSTKKKYATLIRDAKWMPYKEWIGL